MFASFLDLPDKPVASGAAGGGGASVGDGIQFVEALDDLGVDSSSSAGEQRGVDGEDGTG
jgi:hypothetical protein